MCLVLIFVYTLILVFPKIDDHGRSAQGVDGASVSHDLKRRKSNCDDTGLDRETAIISP